MQYIYISTSHLLAATFLTKIKKLSDFQSQERALSKRFPLCLHPLTLAHTDPMQVYAATNLIIMFETTKECGNNFLKNTMKAPDDGHHLAYSVLFENQRYFL